jgi:ech hydrogenase subunit D
MSEKQAHTIVPTPIDRLLVAVDELKRAAWRIVQVLCVSGPQGNELSYSFARALELQSLRVDAPSGAAVPSITAIYPAAFLYENEIRDLFGVRIERIAGDYEGKVYDVAGAPGGGAPFSKVTVQAISSESSPAPAGGIASTGGAL